MLSPCARQSLCACIPRFCTICVLHARGRALCALPLTRCLRRTSCERSGAATTDVECVCRAECEPWQKLQELCAVARLPVAWGAIRPWVNTAICFTLHNATLQR